MKKKPRPQRRFRDLRKEYDKRYCDVVVSQGKCGKSFAEIAAYLGVSTKVLKVWMRKHPEFADAIEYARDLDQAWWERKARESLDKHRFQSAVWAKMMASRFPTDYSDRVVHAGDKDEPIEHVHTIKRVIVRPSGERKST